MNSRVLPVSAFPVLRPQGLIIMLAFLWVVGMNSGPHGRAARTESRLLSPTESSTILSIEFYSAVCLSHSLSIAHLQDVLAAAKL